MLRFYLAIFLLACSCKTQAQFIIAGQHSGSDYFHDVIPDYVMVGYYNTNSSIDSLWIDLNHDGVNDFLLNVRANGSGVFSNVYCRIITLNNNQVAFDHTDSCFSIGGMPIEVWQMARAFHNSDTINENVSWSNGNLYLTKYLSLSVSDPYSCHDATFYTIDTLYLGVRFFSGNDSLYGWIKVTGVTYFECSVLEYACNSDTAIGINEPNEIIPFASVYPNPFTEELNITFSNNKPSQLILYDVLSQTFLEQTFVNSVSVNTSQLSPGIYFYQVRNENKVVTGKVVKALK